MLEGQQGQRTLEVLASLSYRTGELDLYLQSVAEGLSELLGSDLSVVTLCQNGKEQILASSIELEDEGDRHQMYHLHGTVAETVVHTGLPLAVDDGAVNPRYGEIPDGYQAYLGVPLRIPTGDVIGTICSFQLSPRQFTPDEVKLAEIFAERAATAIDNYYLFQQQRQFNHRLETEVTHRTRDLQDAQARLVDAINQLEQRVNERTTALKEANAKLQAKILEQQRVEAELRASRERFHKIFEYSNDAILVLDPEGDRILEANSQACQLLGYTRKELLALESVAIVDPSEIVYLLDFSRWIYAYGMGWTDELTLLTKSGEELLTEISGSIVDFAERSCIIAHVRDITQRKRAEADLLERVRLSALISDISTALTQGETLVDILQGCAEALVHHLDGALARIWIFNEDEQVLELQASGGMCKETHRSHHRIPVGRSQIGQIAQTQTPYLTNTVLGDPNFEYQDWFHAEGLIAFAGYPLLVGDRLVGVMAMFAHQPLTPATLESMAAIANGLAIGIDRKQTELAIAQSEQQLRQIAENLNQIFWMRSVDGTPIYLSPVFETVWGIPSECWYNDSLEWLRTVHPDDRERVLAYSTQPIQQDIEFRIIRPDGQIRIIRNQAFPICDHEGTIYRIAGIAEDITERQQAQDKMVRALEQLAEIGELAAMIVHEVRNPLTTVMMGLNSLHDIELPERMRMRLVLALDEAERLKRLLNEILLYARPQQLERSPIDLHNFLQTQLREMEQMPSAHRRLIQYIPMRSPIQILGDADKLKQVIINLISNACEAVSEGETVICQVHEGLEQQELCIQIHNGGPPIPPELLPILTQPFRTTKTNGNGLGLAITKRIIEAHEGRLVIESSVETGTTVSVYLPKILPG